MHRSSLLASPLPDRFALLAPASAISTEMRSQGSAQGCKEGQLCRAQGKNPVSWKEEKICAIAPCRLRMYMPAL